MVTTTIGKNTFKISVLGLEPGHSRTAFGARRMKRFSHDKVRA
jgi:hypothetical protein